MKFVSPIQHAGLGARAGVPDTSTRRPPEVEPDIHPFRPVSGLDRGRRALLTVKESSKTPRPELRVEVSDMADGEHHDMAGAVRVRIEQGDCEPACPKHMAHVVLFV